jgi:hypothetical protein
MRPADKVSLDVDRNAVSFQYQIQSRGLGSDGLDIEQLHWSHPRIPDRQRIWKPQAQQAMSQSPVIAHIQLAGDHSLESWRACARLIARCPRMDVHADLAPYESHRSDTDSGTGK